MTWISAKDPVYGKRRTSLSPSMDNVGMDPDEASANCCSLIDGRVIGELKAWIGPQTMRPSCYVQVCGCWVIERQRVKLGGLSR